MIFHWKHEYNQVSAKTKYNILYYDDTNDTFNQDYADITQHHITMSSHIRILSGSSMVEILSVHMDLT